MSSRRLAAALLYVAYSACGAACRTQIVFDDGAVSAEPGDAAPPSSESGAPACKVDTDCKLATLHCDAATGACVACLNDAQCTSSGLTYCDPQQRRCVECTASSQCGAQAACESAATHRCIKTCGGAANCPSQVDTCNPVTSFCGNCASSADCVKPPVKPICDPAISQCVQCAADSDCGGAAAHCDRNSGTCVQCTQSSQCAAGAACDPATNTCVTA